MARDHQPEYIYCSDPDTCCLHWHPVAIVCVADQQGWPCETKRSHRTTAQVERIKRWVADRTGRAARSG